MKQLIIYLYRMKKYLQAITLLIAPFLVAAQKAPLYFDKQWRPCDKETAAWVRTFSKQNGVYKVEDRYANGKLYSTCFRTNVENNMVALREGEIVFHDEDGHKIREGEYLHGARVGTWVTYYKGTDKISAKHIIAADENGKDTVYNYDEKTGKLTSMKLMPAEKKKRPVRDDDKLPIPDQPEKQSDDTIVCFDIKKTLISCSKKDETFQYVEHMPSAGTNIPQYLGENITYPKSARKRDIEGRIIVKFVVDEDGGVADVWVVKGIDPECDAEAARVVSEMPFWHPGMQNGVPVRVYFTLPIVFKLE